MSNTLKTTLLLGLLTAVMLWIGQRLGGPNGMTMALVMAAVMNIAGRFLGRDLYGIPLNIILQYVVPVVAVPVLMLFKYGKPRGYLRDLIVWHAKPHIYCGLEPDHELTEEFLK